MVIKCKTKTRSGKVCNNWPMPNGFCEIHGGRTDTSQELSESKNEITKFEENSVSISIKPEEAKWEMCGVITRKGRACKLRVAANGFCKIHQDRFVDVQKSSNVEEATLETTRKDKSSISQELSEIEEVKLKLKPEKAFIPLSQTAESIDYNLKILIDTYSLYLSISCKTLKIFLHAFNPYC